MFDLNPSKKCEKGFSIAEVLIVMFVIAIIVLLALPQINSSRRLFRFSGIQRQVLTVLREARQEAMSQRTAISFRYDDANKQIIISGGTFGNVGDAKNRAYSLLEEGLQPDDVVYGRPAGASVAALGDGTNLTNLTGNTVDITFQTDGSVIDGNNNPQDQAIFFYNQQSPQETAFAISVLGAGGRAKIWRYNQGTNIYVE